MARKIKLGNGSMVKYPDVKDLQEIFEKLSYDEVEGSTVIPADAPESDKIKYKLCRKILEFKILNKLSQKELAEKIDLDEPEISRILHYKIERYSIERLIGYAIIVYPKLTIEV